MQKISPFLWFDKQAEEAVNFYVSIFPNSRIVTTTRYDAASAQVSGIPEGTLMTVGFELCGQPFTAINGGPVYQFTGAISFVVDCENQEEVDHYWNALTEGGDPKAQQCGWVTDKYGVTWQIVPKILPKLLSDPDKAKAGRVMQAMLQMKKIDIAALEQAARG